MDNLQKRLESEQISSDLADFMRSGGQVEKLGVTRTLQRIDMPAEPATAAAPRATPMRATPIKA
jgi:hypothetical protein